MGASRHDDGDDTFPSGFIDTLKSGASEWDSGADGDLRTEGGCSGGANCDSAKGGCDPCGGGDY